MTDTKLDTLPDPERPAADRARDAVAAAQGKVAAAAGATVDRAKDHPFTAAGIAAGVAAAVAGGAFAASKLRDGADKTPAKPRKK